MEDRKGDEEARFFVSLCRNFVLDRDATRWAVEHNPEYELGIEWVCAALNAADKRE